jgi:hypothetical protein
MFCFPGELRHLVGTKCTLHSVVYIPDVYTRIRPTPLKLENQVVNLQA